MKMIRILLVVGCFLASSSLVSCADSNWYERTICHRLKVFDSSSNNRVDEEHHEPAGVMANSEARIAGGYEAKIGEYPAFTRLRISKLNDSGIFTCGATLIEENLLLTARHCIETAIEIMAWPGEVALNSVPAHQAKSYCFLNGFHDSDDIALIELNSSVELNYRTQIARLPSQSLDYGIQAYVVGMGLLNQESDQTAVSLQVLPAERHQCGPDYETGLCLKANDPQFDGTPCHGDSGSGVFVQDLDATQIVQAIVQSAPTVHECTINQTTVPNFVDVYRFIDWIELAKIKLAEQLSDD